MDQETNEYEKIVQALMQTAPLVECITYDDDEKPIRRYVTPLKNLMRSLNVSLPAAQKPTSAPLIIAPPKVLHDKSNNKNTNNKSA